MYKDDHTKLIFGHVCERKGASDTWVIEKIKEDIARLGYQDVILKGDGEPALVQVLENAKRAREAPSITHQRMTHRRTERQKKQFRDYMGQVRAMKIGLEARLKCKVESDWKIMDWITERAGQLLSRGQVGKDGRRAYFRLYGRNSAKAVLEIVEQVMAKPLRCCKSQKKLSLKERWVFATWVGIDAKTNEHVVVIGEGGSCDPRQNCS